MSFRSIDIDALADEQFRQSDYISKEFLPDRSVEDVAESVIATATSARNSIQRYPPHLIPHPS